jgi:two-component system NarL family response regulator
MRIAIVEDDPLLLGSLGSLFSSDPGMTVVGLYGAAEDAMQSIKQASPDVLLTDLGLPGMSGTDLIKKVKAEMPELLIMVYTVFEHAESMYSAIKAGASGCLLKGADPKEIIASVRDLHNGGAVMTPKIAIKVLCEFQNEAGETLFSRPEQAVLNCVAAGMTCAEISENCGLSLPAVNDCIRNIYAKIREKGPASPRPSA